MDNREDPGQYYPGGSVVPARPEPAAHPVESVNGHAGNVVLNASDVGALPDTTAIPTADTVSGWGFLRKTWANLTAAFASIVHTHTKSNITDFAHGHSQSDVTGLTTALAGKQAELVSGTNIKTVNGQSLLGSGNVVIQSGTSAHASTHAAGGADEITPASIGALASNGTAANSLKLGGIDASEYAQVGDVPTVVAPSSSAAEDAAAGAKATGEALATLSASVPTAVSQLSDAGDYLKKSGGEISGELSVVGHLTLTEPRIYNRQYYFDLPDKSGTAALTSDIKTKTSELTNDSGFVTADAIPVKDNIANSSSKIDADGNVFDAGYIYDGGSITDSDGLVYKNCTKSGTKYTWTTDGGVSFTYDSSNGAVETKNGNSTGAGTNKDPFAGAIVVNNFTRWGVTYSHTNTATYDFPTTPTDRLAREYPIKSLTVTGSDATALDSTINTITPTATTTIAPPTAKTIGARDWLVVVTQGTTAYGVTFSGSFVAESGFSWPTMEASKTYVFSFTEVSANKFLAAVKEVSNV